MIPINMEKSHHLCFKYFYPTIRCCHDSDQEERTQSIEQFRKGEKDVLVATDVASKGLDFSDMKHVIN